MPKIEIVSQETAEAADYLVCQLVGLPTPFTDNETGKCTHCGRDVVFRPTAPTKPKRICVGCWVDAINGGHA